MEKSLRLYNNAELPEEISANLERITSSIEIPKILTTLIEKYRDVNVTFSGYYISRDFCTPDEDSLLRLMVLEGTIKLLAKYYDRPIQDEILAFYRETFEEKKSLLPWILVAVLVVLIVVLIIIFFRMRSTDTSHAT
jgi:hypothetical protein